MAVKDFRGLEVICFRRLTLLLSKTMYGSMIWKIASVVVAVAALTFAVLPQSKPGAKTYYFNSDGAPVSNQEFVDIRMANSNYPDTTIVKTLADGSTEFHLQKIPQEGMTAPTFSVRTLDGKTIASNDLKGKVVVLSFWFIGCPACRASEPHLNSLKAKFADRDDIVFLAMTADPADNVKKYLAKERFDYVHATDAYLAMESFVFRTYPKNIVIDRAGKIVYWRGPVMAWDAFESVVRGELAKGVASAEQ